MFEPIVVNTGQGAYLVEADGSYAGVTGAPAAVTLGDDPNDFNQILKNRQNAWLAFLRATAGQAPPAA